MPVESTRRRSTSDAAPARAGLFPETMSILGNRWAFALLVAAFVGTTRFNDFAGQLGAPPGSLADRLQILTAGGVLDAGGGRYAAHREGAGRVPDPDHRAAVGAALVRRARGAGGRCCGTRSCGNAFDAVLTLRPVRGAAARRRGGGEKKFWHSPADEC